MYNSPGWPDYVNQRSLLKIKNTYLLMLCVCLYPHATAGGWSALVFPSHYIGSGDQTQVIRLGWGQKLYLLSDLLSPHTCLICSIRFFLTNEWLKKNEKIFIYTYVYIIYTYMYVHIHTLCMYIVQKRALDHLEVELCCELACRY